jgi:alkylation response protein AidB-like acyl-CoA dehydrogenase
MDAQMTDRIVLRAPTQAARDPVARARALLPLLAAEAPVMEQRQELTPAVLDALAEADFFRLLTPPHLGGQAVSLPVFATVCETLAMADASVAWCVNQGNVSVMSSAACLDPEEARTLFADRRSGLAWGAQHARARAVQVAGGWRVSGTWDFASGNRHAPLLGAHVPAYAADGTTPLLGPGGKPEIRTVLFPKAAARIDRDDWAAMGLRATGSDTYTVEDLFIPDARAIQRDRPEARRDHSPITCISSHLCYASGFSGVALGLARAGLETFKDLARGKQARAGATLMRDNHGVQLQIGELEARLRAVRMYWHATIEATWAEAAGRGALEMETRMALRLATTHALREASEISVACYRGAGTTAILAKEPFERRFRDALCASQHLQGGQWHIEMVGRHLLGVDQEPAFL